MAGAASRGQPDPNARHPAGRQRQSGSRAVGSMEEGSSGGGSSGGSDSNTSGSGGAHQRELERMAEVLVTGEQLR